MAQTPTVPSVPLPTPLSRDSFPPGFLFGAASSAYQYEGAVDEGRKGESIWDHFSHKYPERTNGEDGKVADDFYHRYKEDIKRLKDINMDTFRLSISWVRILPQGKKERGVNQEGIDFYKDVIDELIRNNMTPMVTLFHWDTPQVLEDEYLGFLDERVIDDFRDYASICFNEFGEKVKYWVTINEPWVFSIAGYDTGKKAPGRGSKYVNKACEAGQSGVEAYIVSHNLLLAHAAAVEEFRKCSKTKDGKIGIAHCPLWFEPYDPHSSKDREACKRALEFMFGWHMHPTTFGDYPQVMKDLVGKRLPSFTPEQSKKLMNSYDFVGINYYSSVYAKSIENVDPAKPCCNTDQRAEWKSK